MPFGLNQNVVRNGKKEALLERKLISKLVIVWCLERYTEIERENRILLEKMSNIMQKKQSYSQNGVPTVNYNRKSLNGEQRRKELIKITIENQAIL